MTKKPKSKRKLSTKADAPEWTAYNGVYVLVVPNIGKYRIEYKSKVKAWFLSLSDGMTVEPLCQGADMAVCIAYADKHIASVRAEMARHTRPKFHDLDDAQTDLYIAKAQTFVQRQGWTWDEFDYLELVHGTAVFLYETERLLKHKTTYPCYVVHSAETESRTEYASYAAAFDQFKRLKNDKQRVALFHWESAQTQNRLAAVQDYPYSKDYGPKED